MDELIEQARNEGKWHLVEQLYFSDFVMDKMIELEKIVKEKNKVSKN